MVLTTTNVKLMVKFRALEEIECDTVILPMLFEVKHRQPISMDEDIVEGGLRPTLIEEEGLVKDDQ